MQSDTGFARDITPRAWRHFRVRLDCSPDPLACPVISANPPTRVPPHFPVCARSALPGTRQPATYGSNSKRRTQNQPSRAKKRAATQQEASFSWRDTDWTTFLPELGTPPSPRLDRDFGHRRPEQAVHALTPHAHAERHQQRAGRPQAGP